jgi:hypothetical protein
VPQIISPFPNGDVADNLTVRLSFDHTLMRLDRSVGVHVPEPPLPKVWFLEVPAPWLAAPDRLAHALQQIFTAENQRLRAREPGDPNYLAAMNPRAEAIAPAAEGPFPWEIEARIIWESSCCWATMAANAGTDWRPIPPSDFTALYLLRGLEAGTLARERFLELVGGKLFRLAPEAAARLADHPAESIERLISRGAAP